jgi:small subunit ribosomal protein S5
MSEIATADQKVEAFLGGSAQQDDRGTMIEKVVHINRCAKVVKGGRRFSFSALVVTGDQQGKIGLGFGKANEVSDAIKKATEASKKDFVTVNLRENTIPHEVVGQHGGGYIMLKPAAPGTGIIAGGGARAVLEAVGVKDVLAKSLGSSNHSNVVKATLAALLALRTADTILKSLGKQNAEKKAL